MKTIRISGPGIRRSAIALVAVATLALAGCSQDVEVSPLELAKQDVAAKEKAVTEAEAAFTTASADFCSVSADYVSAVDVYADVITDTAPTVADVKNAGADLIAPRDDAMTGAQAAVDAQDALVAAKQDLIDAQVALAAIEAGPSGTPSPVDTTKPSATPLAPAASVERVQQAEADFAAAERGIDDNTPLRGASEPFHSAAVALELSWMKLFADTGCATDEQIKRVSEAVTAYSKALQQDLADAGYYTGQVDGIYGPLTVKAVEDLQTAYELPVTGTVDRATALALQAELAKQGLAAAGDALTSTTAVQTTLKLLGLWDGPVDGVWTDELTEAVKELQTKLGVEPTGVIDAETVAAFEEALAKLQELVSPSPTPSPTASPSPSA